MDTLERGLRAAATPVRFTEGFNPHIRLSMGPALSVGHEGVAELFDVDATAPLGPAHLEQVNRRLPRGLELVEVRPLVAGAPSLGKLVAAARYRLPHELAVRLPGSREEIPGDLVGGVIAWQRREDGSLVVELNLRQQAGPTPTVKKLLAALGLEPEEVARTPPVREMLVLRPPAAAEAPAQSGETGR